MPSRYFDSTAIMHLIGCVYKEPHILLQDDKYRFTEEDFTEQFHKIIFGSIYKLFKMGARVITLETISDFLETKPKAKAIYEKNKGDEYLSNLVDIANINTFDYYYARVKKMTLLRAYDNFGLDVSFIYDIDNILDSKKRQQQEEWFDNATLEDIVFRIDDKMSSIKDNFLENVFGKSARAGDGAKALIERLKITPEVGVPLYGNFINTVTRGARLKKFYLRSAPTGMGKTRSFIADCCNIGCTEIYDKEFGWTSLGKAEPCVFISTEQELDEVQTMMLAFLSDIDEDKILSGQYEGDEEDRVLKAAELLEKSNIFIEELPDFSLQDIENIIKKHIRENDVKYVFHDYIHTSLKILEEISKKTGGVKLREDTILFMISIRLKDICNKLGVFIFSATQLNGDYVDSKTYDQNLLRGAKAIADKIDLGMILLPVTNEDLDNLKTILSTQLFEVPVIKISLYKNRRGKFKSVFLWCKANLGTCRIQPMFMTTHRYELLQINNLKVKVREESAF